MCSTFAVSSICNAILTYRLIRGVCVRVKRLVAQAARELGSRGGQARGSGGNQQSSGSSGGGSSGGGSSGGSGGGNDESLGQRLRQGDSDVCTSARVSVWLLSLDLTL